MVSPIVVLLDPQGAIVSIKLTRIRTTCMPGNFYENLSFLMTTLYLYGFFCDYLPFEGDLALHSANLEFCSPNDYLYRV
jgi:hypothetical protein